MIGMTNDKMCSPSFCQFITCNVAKWTFSLLLFTSLIPVSFTSVLCCSWFEPFRPSISLKAVFPFRKFNIFYFHFRFMNPTRLHHMWTVTRVTLPALSCVGTHEVSVQVDVLTLYNIFVLVRWSLEWMPECLWLWTRILSYKLIAEWCSAEYDDSATHSYLQQPGSTAVRQIRCN